MKSGENLLCVTRLSCQGEDGIVEVGKIMALLVKAIFCKIKFDGLRQTVATPYFKLAHYCYKGWTRSLARIKVSAFGAGDRGFKSYRARSICVRNLDQV